MNTTIKYVLFLLFFVVLIDPGNEIFKAKELLLFGVLILWLLRAILTKAKIFIQNEFLTLLFLFGIVVPIYTFLVGAISQIDFSLSAAVQYLKAFLILPVAVIAVDQRINVYKYFIFGSLAIVCISLFEYIVIDQFIPEQTYYLVEKNAAFISRRRFGPILFDPVIFYKTSPLLIFPLAYFSKHLFAQKKIIYKVLYLGVIILITTVLVISATRANILSAAIILLFFAYDKIKRALKVIGVALALILTVALIINSRSILDSFLDKKEKSNTIKLGHLNSYFDHFKEYPHILLTGQGFGTYFYSEGKGEKIQQSELTLLELIRMMGIPVTFFFLLLLIYPIFVLQKKGQWINLDLRIGYLLYLLQIIANPLLLGSTGMIVYVLMLSEVYKKKQLNEK